MMNRKILAIAITAATISTVANAAEVYNKDGNKIDLIGKVEAEYKFRGKENPEYDGAHRAHHNNEDGSFARFGFIGETQINSELTGYAKFEHEFSASHSESESSDKTRYAYVGLKFANYGSLDFGRNYGVVGLIRDFTDQAAVFGGSGFGGDTDVFLTDRASSVATYSNHDFFAMVPGWDFYLQYQAKNTDRDIEEQHGDGMAFATTYHHAETGLGGGFTYAKSDRSDEQQMWGLGNSANGKTAEMWGIAANYDANNIYVGLSWAESNNMLPVTGDSGLYEIANKTRGFEAVANYTFDFGLTPSIAYNQLRGRDLHGFTVTNTNPYGQGNAYLAKYVSLGAKYEFNKNMDMAVGYKINLLDKDAAYTRRANLASDDQVEMRLTYTF